MDEKPEIDFKMNSVKISDDDSYVKVKVNPKVNFKELKKGDVIESVGDSAISFEFGKTFEQSDVEIMIRVNGNLHSVLSSPAKDKNFSASFVATKRF